MVLAYHFIFSAYGFWLPNDPRGSWSDTIRVYELLRFGPATKVTTTANLARQPHDRKARLAAKESLAHEPVKFDGRQALEIAHGFENAKRDHDYRFLALAILPDHVHVIVERHALDVAHIARHLKAKATMRLNETGLHPFATTDSIGSRQASPWARNFWAPFIDDEGDLDQAIRYVKRNPPRSGLPEQRWKIVDQQPEVAR